MFLEFWKRKNASIAYRWGVSEFEKEEPTRPEWYGTVLRVSPITGKRQIHFPRHHQLAIQTASAITVAIAVCIL